MSKRSAGQRLQIGDVANYLRNVALYLLDLRREIHTGEAIDGPGESNLSWTAEALDNGIADPPRRALRLYPKRNSATVSEVLAAIPS